MRWKQISFLVGHEHEGSRVFSTLRSAIDFSSVSKMLASEIFAITISKTKLLITRNHTD